MSQRTQPSIVLLMIGMAIILAAGLFLAMSAIQNRPDVPEGVEVVNVAGQDVMLRRDPNLIVRLAEPAAPPAEAAPQEGQEAAPPAQQEEAPAPTATPVPETTGGEPEPTATPIPPTAVPDAIIFIDYTIQGSDTLYSIARRMDTSIVLMARYGISSDDLVNGAVIKLPVGNPNFCPQGRPYAVGGGDTAFNIGKRFGITAEELQRINNLDADYNIRVGEIICVP